MTHTASKQRLFVLAGALLLASCRGDAPDRLVGPRGDLVGTSDAIGTSLGAVVSPLLCPAASDQVANATIGPAGGTLSLRGARIVVPPGAVPEPTSFTIELPATEAVELLASTGDGGHYSFQAPVTVTLSLARCGSSSPSSGLAAWYFDPATGTVLQYMGGSVDAASQTFTFSTDHFSGYVIAN